MYKIAICDDDKRYRKTIREIVEHENSLPENEIRFYEYESGNELLKHTDILHELVFIDIRMPGLDGNQTALKLRNYNKDAVLIFYSSYFEPTVDSINFGQPFRYIMKDLHDTSLRREIEAIMTEVKRRFLNDYAVTVTSAGKIIRIHVENILYVSRAKRGCVITIVKEQEKETVRCREAFGELCEQLKDQGFAQAHYSYIVNLEKVEGLERGVLYKLVKDNRVTPAALICTMYMKTLMQYSKNKEFSLNLTLFNRLPLSEEIYNLIGDFTNIGAIAYRQQKDFWQEVNFVQKQLWELVRYHSFDGTQILKMIDPMNRGKAILPVVFTGVLQGDRKTKGFLPNGISEGYAISQTPQVVLDYQATDFNGELLVNWDYVIDAFDVEMIHSMFSENIKGLRLLIYS